jgi:hypothetical protein
MFHDEYLRRSLMFNTRHSDIKLLYSLSQGKKFFLKKMALIACLKSWWHLSVKAQPILVNEGTGLFDKLLFLYGDKYEYRNKVTLTRRNRVS